MERRERAFCGLVRGSAGLGVMTGEGCAVVPFIGERRRAANERSRCYNSSPAFGIHILSGCLMSDVRWNPTRLRV